MVRKVLVCLVPWSDAPPAESTASFRCSTLEATDSSIVSCGSTPHENHVGSTDDDDLRSVTKNHFFYDQAAASSSTCSFQCLLQIHRVPLAYRFECLRVPRPCTRPPAVPYRRQAHGEEWRGRTRKREPTAPRKSIGTRKRACSPLGRARSSGLGKNDTSHDTWTGRLSVRSSANTSVRYQQLRRRSGDKWSGRWESNPRQ